MTKTKNTETPKHRGSYDKKAERRAAKLDRATAVHRAIRLYAPGDAGEYDELDAPR